MNRFRNARWVTSALAFTLSAVCSANSVTEDAAFQAIVRDPSTASWQILPAPLGLEKRSASSILESETLPLQLPDGLQVQAIRLRSHATEAGVEVWAGLVADTAQLKSGAREIIDDPLNSALIVRHAGRLTGSIRVEGQLYRLLPLHDGTQVVVKVNEERRPADHPHGHASGSLSPAGRPFGFQQPRWNWTGEPNEDALSWSKDPAPIVLAAKANTVIRVMVVATNAAAQASGDITGLINLAIAESNQSYANSGVQISLQLAGLYTTTYAESGSFSTDLSRFRGTSDGYMDSIHSLRNQNAADVAMIVLNNSSSCGLASAIGATASTAFASVAQSCATGYYSFAHEIGHLQSARHDPSNDPTNSPYAYGHGYQSPTKAWRSVMGYNCSPSCPRINYWSNPLKTYGGQAMGTAARSDNARVLNNTRGTISSFR